MIECHIQYISHCGGLLPLTPPTRPSWNATSMYVCSMQIRNVAFLLDFYRLPNDRQARPAERVSSDMDMDICFENRNRRSDTPPSEVPPLKRQFGFQSNVVLIEIKCQCLADISWDAGLAADPQRAGY